MVESAESAIASVHLRGFLSARLLGVLHDTYLGRYRASGSHLLQIRDSATSGSQPASYS